LLVEKGEKSVAPELRKRLADRDAAPSATITALNTLDQLGALTPADLPPFVSHADPSLRIHALQIGDHWFAQDEGRLLLSASLAAAAIEKNPRVQIQFALSLGQCVHPEAFAMLKVYATEHMDVRWMDAAILSSLHGRAGEMLGQLLGSSGGATPTAFLALLAQAVAARRDEPELARTLRLIVAAEPSKQVVLLNALAGGRKNAPRKPLADNAGRAALATLAASEDTEVRQAARTLESTFLPAVAEEDGSLPAKRSYGPESVSEEVFGKFVSALAAPRNRQHGHEVFLKACATCHRIGAEGHELGPDLAGQIGMAEESLLKDILMPDERIRPGYETTLVLLADGSAITGILKDDGATGLTLAMPNGSEQVLLRKDTTGTRRLATSVMPSFAEGLTPVEVADLLAWLRSVFGVVEPKPAPGYYELRIYSVTSNKLDGVLERFRDTVEPVRRRHGITTIGYWIAATTDGDKFIYLMGAANAGRLKEQEQAFGGDVDFQKGYTASNARHGRTVDKIETLPLNVDTAVRFDFFASRTPRAFELRIYSVLPGKLDAFRNRWRDHAVPIYERHGLHSLGWWVTDKKGIDGNDQFAVLLAGESEDSIRQSIAAFHRDAEWQLIEKETERDGKLRSSVDAYKMRATDFSSLK
jgi:putative heme-binding domain-containing protein